MLLVVSEDVRPDALIAARDALGAVEGEKALRLVPGAVAPYVNPEATTYLGELAADWFSKSFGADVAPASGWNSSVVPPAG